MSLRDMIETDKSFEQRKAARPAAFSKMDPETTLERVLIEKGDWTQNRYRMTLAVHNDFWATPAEAMRAEKYAIEEVAHFLYQDVFKHLPRLRSAIASYDWEAAMSITDDIEREMRP